MASHKNTRAARHQPSRIAPDYAAMLAEAVSKPGTVAAAYRAFHAYSVGNQIWAALQLAMRGLPLSPIASYRRWQELGRQVRKGETALSLYMPVICRARSRDAEAREERDDTIVRADDAGDGATFTRFVCRPHWFALCQTDGPEAPPEVAVPEWDAASAMAALGVTEEPFADLRGNVGGYAYSRTIAISPLAPQPHHVRLHELAHVVLGHTADGATMADSETLDRAEREVEAEAVAYLCLASLELPGLAEARGYLQGWLAGETLQERSIARIFRATDQILKTGRPTAATDGAACAPEAAAA